LNWENEKLVIKIKIDIRGYAVSMWNIDKLVKISEALTGTILLKPPLDCEIGYFNWSI
jgi:hypothetical protein